jgi:hypothetical protein
MGKDTGKAQSAAKKLTPKRAGVGRTKAQAAKAEKLANAEKKQGHRFKKGQSGNPAGKPKGTRHRTTMLAERLMQKDAAEIVSAVISAAKGGDITAARIILERIAPPRKDSAVSFKLPPITSASDASGAMTAVLRAVAAGDVTPGEATDVGRLIETFIKTHEVSDLEKRIAALEGRPHDANGA